MSEQTVERDDMRCQAPGCGKSSVTAEPDAADPPRYWRVCTEHLRAIRPERQYRRRKRRLTTPPAPTTPTPDPLRSAEGEGRSDG